MRVFWVVVLVLIVDQLTKVWVKTTMFLGQSVPVAGDWFRLTFTENPGMAFGITVGPRPFTTVFAVLATLGLSYALWRVRRGHPGYRSSLALILGGAIGNIIDRTFYGKIFGYGDFFHGQVVDFIHFNVWRGTLSVPFVGERYVALFPIWNVADMAIVVGAVAIMLFHNRFHAVEEPMPEVSRGRSVSPGRSAVRVYDAPADDAAAEARAIAPQHAEGRFPLSFGEAPAPREGGQALAG